MCPRYNWLQLKMMALLLTKSSCRKSGQHTQEKDFSANGGHNNSEHNHKDPQNLENLSVLGLYKIVDLNGQSVACKQKVTPKTLLHFSVLFQILQLFSGSIKKIIYHIKSTIWIILNFLEATLRNWWKIYIDIPSIFQMQSA